jgi:peptidoglycan/LPS O-acetylase OafA/YrhL
VVAHPTAEKSYYYSLDLLRFLAALLVLGFHLGFSSWVSPTSAGAKIVDGSYTIPQTVHFVWFGWVGVQIFFVISGFVIANSANGASPIGFVRGRIERLYPAAWICASITAIVWLVTGLVPLHTLLARWIGSVTLWPRGPWIDGQYWTLACEIVFYAAVFCLIAIRQFKRIEALAILLTALGAGFVSLLAMDRLGLIHVPQLTLFTKGPLLPLPFYYGQFFGIGVLIWLQTQKRLSPIGWIAGGVALVAGCVQIGMGAYTAVHIPDRLQFNLQDEWLVPVILWVASCLIVMLSKPLAAQARGWRPGTLSAIRVLGLATYPQYLVHFALGIWLIHGMVVRGTPPLLAFFIAAVAIVILSCLIATVLEVRIRRFLRHAVDWLIARSRLGGTALMQRLSAPTPRLTGFEGRSPAELP